MQPRHDERKEKLRNLLREARKKAGLTQDVLGERLGAYKSFVSKYEKGERRLDVVEFIAVAEALGLEPEAIVSAIKIA